MSAAAVSAVAALVLTSGAAAKGRGRGKGNAADAGPAAVDPNATGGSEGLLEVYVESLLNGKPGSGLPTFDVTTLGDQVISTRDDGVIVARSEPELESLARGLTGLPPQFMNTPAVNQGGVQDLVGGLLGLLNP